MEKSNIQELINSTSNRIKLLGNENGEKRCLAEVFLVLVDDNAEQAPALSAAKKAKKGDGFLDDIYSMSSASITGNEVHDYLVSTDSSDDILFY